MIAKKLLLVIGIIAFLTACSEERESLTVSKSDLVEAVYSSVTVQPQDIYTVKSSVSGYLEAIKFQEGSKVNKGDLLFVIRDIVGSSAEQNARLAFELAQKNFSGERSVLEDIELEIKNQALRRKTDSLNYERMRKLLETGNTTPVELEKSQLAFEASKSAHETAKNRYKRTAQELKTALEQSKNNLASSSSRSGEANIHAELQGKVYSVFKEHGDLVNMQEPIAILGSADNFEILLLVDEVDITRVHEGQRIIIRLESYPDEVFEAAVHRIVPKMDEQTQTFQVIGHFVKKPATLYMGLTGEASIIIQEKNDVVVIPRDYINANGEVETEGGLRKIKMGIQGLSEVEVLEGLKAGEIIFKPTK